MFSYGLEYMFFKDSYFAYSVAKNNEKARYDCKQMFKTKKSNVQNSELKT